MPAISNYKLNLSPISPMDYLRERSTSLCSSERCFYTFPFSQILYLFRSLTSLKEKLNFKTTAETFYHQMTREHSPIEVKVDPVTSYAAALSRNKTLYLHPLTMIGPNDLPIDLRVTSPDDPRLKSPHYFVRLKNWLANKFDIDPKKFTSLRKIFNMHLRTWQKPHLINRIKHFAIAHEVGHIFYGHTNKSWDRFFGFIVSVIISMALFETLPFLAAILCSLAVSDVCYRAFKALREYTEQYQEKEADLKALEVTKDYIGAKAFFSALDDNDQNNWNNLSLAEKCKRYLLYPETLFHISHPSPQTRIQYLKA